MKLNILGRFPLVAALPLAFLVSQPMARADTQPTIKVAAVVDDNDTDARKQDQDLRRWVGRCTRVIHKFKIISKKVHGQPMLQTTLPGLGRVTVDMEVKNAPNNQIEVGYLEAFVIGARKDRLGVKEIMGGSGMYPMAEEYKKDRHGIFRLVKTYE